jgi:hypothetical protein
VFLYFSSQLVSLKVNADCSAQVRKAASIPVTDSSRLIMLAALRNLLALAGRSLAQQDPCAPRAQGARMLGQIHQRGTD